MEPQDRDYEHCGGCACLSECGCNCPECKGAMRTMVEVGHGDGCGCSKGSESSAAMLREALPLLSKSREVIDDELENLPARHSLGKLHAELKHFIEKWEARDIAAQG